jgi:hypothetical protein
MATKIDNTVSRAIRMDAIRRKQIELYGAPKKWITQSLANEIMSMTTAQMVIFAHNVDTETNKSKTVNA